MEDIKLGRELASIAKSKTATLAAPVTIAEADMNRTRLVFATQGAAVKIAPEGADIASAGTFVISNVLPPLVIRVEEYGKLCGAPWQGQGVAGDVSVLVVESTLKRQS